MRQGKLRWGTAWCCLLVLFLLGEVSAADVDGRDARLFELRIYWAHPEKLSALEQRFREHTVDLFTKHGITQIGYWVPVENREQQLYYLLAYPSQEARQRSWRALLRDPQWKEAYRASRKDGPLVRKVEARFLQATDYSPLVRIRREPPRIFELRRYRAVVDRMPDLQDRFRDYTMSLLDRHGIHQLGYWVPIPDQPGASDTLYFLLSHPSLEAAEKAFDSFRKDPNWQAAKAATEAGGTLIVQDGVQSTYLQATDFSPLQ